MISPGMKRFYIYATVFAIAFLLLFVPIVIPMLSREADCSVFNSSWNGSSEFYSNYISDVGYDSFSKDSSTYYNAILGDYSSIDIIPTDSMILIIGPTSEYDDADLEFIETFVDSGGVIVLGDDFGTGNEILSYLGLSERFSNKVLLDLAYEKSGTFPVSYQSAQEASTYSLLLNYPSTITGSEAPLLYSSVTSFIDSNDNGRKDVSEPFDSYVICASADYGDGKLLLFSDPSIFINTMIGKRDNYDTIYLFLKTFGNERTLYVDEAHFLSTNEFKIVDIIISSTNNSIFILLITALLAIIALVELHILSALKAHIGKIGRKVINRREKVNKGITREELLEQLLSRNPEWDRLSLYQYFSKFR